MKQAPSRSVGGDAPVTSGNPIDPIGNKSAFRRVTPPDHTSGNPIDPIGNKNVIRRKPKAPDHTSGNPIDPIGNKRLATPPQARPHLRSRAARQTLKRSGR